MAVFLFLVSCSDSQQIPDKSFRYKIKVPAYSLNEGPVVLIDEAHDNFHTIDGRYRPFAELLKQDGYQVRPSKSNITDAILATCEIFVISVPTSGANKSAFSEHEIYTLKNWVRDGGSLLLITDHMPDPPAIADLAEMFGIMVKNGYVLNESHDEEVGIIQFRKQDGTLADHPTTSGREGLDEGVDSVASFTGCAFEAIFDVTPLFIFGPDKTCWLTEKPGDFPPDTPRIDVEGWYQGGVREYGRGRVAFFGEAGMFTAQIITKNNIKFGMNVPIAAQNPQFLLNVFHWLSGVI